MKDWFAGVAKDGTQILRRGRWDRVRKHFEGKAGLLYHGFATEARAKEWLSAQASPLELELRKMLDVLPDPEGPVRRGRLFRETFVDVWVMTGRKSVPRNPIR